MKRSWTEESAVRFLKNRGAKVNMVAVSIKKGSLGLTGCGACDFLRNHSKIAVYFI